MSKLLVLVAAFSLAACAGTMSGGSTIKVTLSGARGANGPVIVPLSKSGDTYTAPPGAKLNDAQMQALNAGNLYVNAHTNRNKGGEVRAQLQP